MGDRLTWQNAFRQGDAPAVVRALHQAWTLLATVDSPDTFRVESREPELTELLCVHLRETKHKTKLSGFWHYESQQGETRRVSAQGKRVHKRKRTDILFTSDRCDPPLELVFEFKKLGRSKPRRDAYCGEEGMLRFVTGEYSKFQPLAVMVGILIEHRDDCLPPLIRFLDSAEAKTLLHLESVRGKNRHIPSRFFPDESPFDTEHLRPTDRAPAHGTIVISHLFLEPAGLPPRHAKATRRQSLVAALDELPP
jgi:hypothetical protein